MAGSMIALAGLQAIPVVNGIVDAALAIYIYWNFGKAGISFLGTLLDVALSVNSASFRCDLNTLGEELGDAIITLGVSAFDLLDRRGGFLKKLDENRISNAVPNNNLKVGIKDNGGSSGTPGRTTRTIEELLPGGKVPSVRNNEFNKWFDNLSAEEFDLLWSNPKIRTRIEERIRHPKKLHEWCMVCRAPKFKRWGLSMDEIKRFRTRTIELKWIHPDTGVPGGHSGDGAGKFHNELKKITDDSSSLKEFNQKLIQLRNRWKIDPSILPDFPKSD